MSRIFLTVLDSLGIGAAPDADKFGDVGANTLKRISTSKSKRRKTKYNFLINVPIPKYRHAFLIPYNQIINTFILLAYMKLKATVFIC